MIGLMVLCDFCISYGRTVVAEYDGRTVFGSCSYMCLTHFTKFGMGLGRTVGQKILTKPSLDY